MANPVWAWQSFKITLDKAMNHLIQNKLEQHKEFFFIINLDRKIDFAFFVFLGHLMSPLSQIFTSNWTFKTRFFFKTFTIFVCIEIK